MHCPAAGNPAQDAMQSLALSSWCGLSTRGSRGREAVAWRIGGAFCGRKGAVLGSSILAETPYPGSHFWYSWLVWRLICPELGLFVRPDPRSATAQTTAEAI